MLKRLLVALFVFGWFAWGFVHLSADTVYYIDPVSKKEVTIDGPIQEETPSGLKIKDKTGVKTITPQAIRQITYTQPKVGAADFRKPFTAESKALSAEKPADKKKFFADALQIFDEMREQLRDQPNAHRYIKFKIAQMKVRLAQLDPDDKKLADAASAALNEYRTDFTTGWEIVPCLQMMAEYEEQKGDLAKAQAAYETLVLIPDAPPELKQKSEILIAQMMVRGRRYAEAEKKLEVLQKTLAPDDPQRAFITVTFAEALLNQNKLDQAETSLKTALGASTDPTLRATAHNLLGDFYLLKRQDEEAFWHYLRVDTLYSQDRTEHAKALYHLWKLFDKVKNDPARAEQCHEKLTTDKAYAATDYGRRAAKEKPEK